MLRFRVELQVKNPSLLLQLNKAAPSRPAMK